MSELAAKIAEKLAFRDADNKRLEVLWRMGAEAERERTKALDEALVAAVELCEKAAEDKWEVTSESTSQTYGGPTQLATDAEAVLAKLRRAVGSEGSIRAIMWTK